MNRESVINVRLVPLFGKNAGRPLESAARRWLIGRAEDCQLRPQSELVSRHHCVVWIDEGEAYARDLGSRNGTLVNGARIEREQLLHHGDELRVGPCRFEIRLEMAPAAELALVARSPGEASAVGPSAQASVPVAVPSAGTGEQATTPGSVSDTARAPAANPTPGVSPAPAASPTPAVGKVAAGAVPRQAVPAPKSSGATQSAAADTLRRFFRRKR